jgi:hypothetical protein
VIPKSLRLTHQADQEILEADVRAFMDDLIEQVNTQASAHASEVWGDAQSFERVTDFLPKSTATKDSPDSPEGAQAKSWTDHPALAQPQTHAFTWRKCEELATLPATPHFRAVVSVDWIITRRSAFVGKPAEPPRTPEGWQAWHPSGRSLRVAGGI